MTSPIAEFYVKIGDEDVKRVDRSIDELHGTMKNLDPSIKQMESGFLRASKALSGVAGIIGTIGVIKFGNDVFQASLKMENLNKMLVANEGSQKKANIAMAKYLEMAKAPGLNLTQITQGMTQLKSLGVSTEQATRTINALGNAMALSGRGAEEFGRVMIQFEQMIGKGKLMSQDLRVIAESMPMIRKLMKDAFGEVDPEKLAKMGITSEVFMAKITEQMEKMPRAIGGTQNSIDNFRDSLLQFEAALGKTVMPTVQKLLDFATKTMDAFNKLPEGTKNVVGAFTVGGVGLLGMAFALSLIVEHGGKAIAVLKGLAGAQALAGGAGALAGAAPLASGLVNQFGRPIASVGAAGAGAAIGAGTFGTIAMTVGAVTIAALGGVTIGGIIGSLLPKPGFARGPLKTEAATPEELAKSEAYMKLHPGAIPPELADVIKKNTTYTEGALRLTEQNADVLKAEFDAYIKVYDDATKKLIESRPNIEFLMQPYGYSTEAGKYALKSKVLSAEKPTGLPAIKPFELPGIGPGLLPTAAMTQGYDIDIKRLETLQRMDKQTAELAQKDFKNTQKAMDDYYKDWTDNMDKGEKAWYELEQAAAKFAEEKRVKAEIEAQNIELTDQLLVINDTITAWKELKKESGFDVKINTDDIDKANKKQSQFWNDMQNMGLNAIDSVSDKFVSSQFDKLFKKSRVEEAWKDYVLQAEIAGNKVELTFDEFSDNWAKQNKLNSQSWTEFCQNMVEDFTKALVKMEIEAEATNLFNLLSGKGYGGGGGIGDLISGLSKGSKSIQGGTAAVEGGSTATKAGGAGGLSGLGGIGLVLAAAYAEQQGAKMVGSAYGAQAHKVTSSFWGKIGNYIPAGMLINWGLRSGAKDWRESQGLESYPMAAGGSGIVTKPTMFMMGEAGPEAYNIQPLSKGKTSSIGGSSLHVENINISFPNADPDRMDKGRFKHLIVTSLRELANDGTINKAVI